MNIRNILKLTFFITIFGFFITIGKSIKGMINVNKRIEKASEVVVQLDNQRQKLIKNNEERNSDNYFEKQIRDRLKLVKKDEVLVVLPKELDCKEADSGFGYIYVQKESVEPLLPWQKWFDVFL